MFILGKRHAFKETHTYKIEFFLGNSLVSKIDEFIRKKSNDFSYKSNTPLILLAF